MTTKDVDLKACAILFPALVLFMLLAIIVAAFRAGITEIDHWLPEFVSTWRFVARGSEG